MFQILPEPSGVGVTKYSFSTLELEVNSESKVASSPTTSSWLSKFRNERRTTTLRPCCSSQRRYQGEKFNSAAYTLYVIRAFALNLMKALSEKHSTILKTNAPNTIPSSCLHTEVLHSHDEALCNNCLECSKCTRTCNIPVPLLAGHVLLLETEKLIILSDLYLSAENIFNAF